MSTHSIYFFSPSLLVTAALLTFNEEGGSSTGLVTCLIFLGCFCFVRQWSFSSHPHPLNQFLFSFLGLRLIFVFRFGARSRVKWSFAGAPVLCLFVFLLLQIRLFFLARQWSSVQKKELAAGLDPSDLPRKCTRNRAFSPKTTVSWQTLELYKRLKKLKRY